MKRRRTTRERLAELLEKAGYPLTRLPRGAQGYNRIYKHLDDTTVCWDGWTRPAPYRTVHVCSYDTMTDCVRYGLTVADDGDTLLWVYANKPQART